MHESWLAVLGDELEQPYMAELREFLVGEVAAGRRFYPPADRVFNALALTPFDDVRVVILGQDPYHGAGQAMGLCFSVPAGVRPPPSLLNIHSELESQSFELNDTIRWGNWSFNAGVVVSNDTLFGQGFHSMGFAMDAAEIEDLLAYMRALPLEAGGAE